MEIALNKLEENILNIYGEKGKVWLQHLPHEVKKISELWGLRDLKPFDNLTFNYVLSGFKEDQPIVLKLSLDFQALNREVKALALFKGYGGIPVLNYMEGALLLQGFPNSTSLKNCANKKESLRIACEVMKRLHQAPCPKENLFPKIQDLMATLDKNWDIPRDLLYKARNLKDQLLPTISNPILLHGDLHRNNILLVEQNRFVLDPKGIIGAPENEIWAFVEDPSTDLEFIAQYFNFDLEMVSKWYFVHIILSACWNVEDNIDPRYFLDIAKSFY